MNESVKISSIFWFFQPAFRERSVFLIGIEELNRITSPFSQATAQNGANWRYIFPYIAYKRPIWHSHDLKQVMKTS